MARVHALAEEGFEVIPFAHADHAPNYPFFRAKPDSLVVINQGVVDRINPVLSLVRTWRLLRHYQPDIVLTTGYERAESLAAILFGRTSLKAGRRPVVILMTDSRAADRPRRRFMERVKSIYLSAFDGILASGSDSRDYLQQLRVPPSRVQLGYDCVDNDTIATLVARYRSDQSATPAPRYFLCIARLIARKNVPGVILAYHSYLQSVSGSVPLIKLVICGDGPERSRTKDLIDRLRLSDMVSMVGEIHGVEALAAQLANCMALVLASTRDEPWGLVVNEALAASCPVVVSKQCGCARDLVEHGINGFVFDADDSDELAGHLLWLHVNSALLESMGRRSKEIVARFSTSRFAASVSTLGMSAGHTS